jgi:hypothetical protein
MRDHVRREAAQSVDAAWWLVPLVFTVAAVATVAFTGPPVEDATSAALVQPAAAPAPALPVAPAPQGQPEQPVYDVAEHVQAF